MSQVRVARDSYCSYRFARMLVSVVAVCALALASGVPSGAAEDMIVNGGFETGDFSGWVRTNTGGDDFVINDGSVDSCDGPLPPFEGNYSTVSRPGGPGYYTIYQDVSIPAGTTSATLRWTDRIRNHGNPFEHLYQEFNVEIRNTADQVLSTAFTTNPGDPLLNDWVSRSVDVSEYAGQTIRVAFTKVEFRGPMCVYLDNIGLEVETVPVSIYSETMDTDPGWTTTGEWAFGTPQGNGGRIGFHDPTSGYTGSNVYGVNLNGDYNTWPDSPYYLTSQPIACSQYYDVHLKFRRWLNTDWGAYVTATVDASNDGTSWTPVYANPASSPVTDNAWQLVEYDISSVADGKAAVYVRWGHQVVQGDAYPYSGWNIDDVELTGIRSLTVDRDEWWMFRHDMQHTGCSPFEGSNTPTKRWEFQTGSGVDSSPAIGSDWMIYVGSYDGKLYAMNPDGSKKWEFQTWGPAHSSPAIGYDGTIYVGSQDGKLYAINPNGSKKWEFQTGSVVRSSPAIGCDRTIYVGSYDGKLYAIDPNGSKKWEFQAGGGVDSSPAIGSDRTAYVGSSDGRLYAIAPDGSKKWEFQTGGGVDSSPAIGSDGTIYVGSQDGKLYAIDPDGSKKWEFQTGSGVDSSPAIGSDGTIYVGSWDSKLYAIEPNGSKKWEFQTGGGVDSSPAIGSGGTVYVGSQDGKLYAIGLGHVTGTPDLMEASDSGVSSSDNITNLDNSNSLNRLQFLVGNTIPGALVKLYSDGTVVGSETATSADTVVITDGSLDLADGVRSITATQTESGEIESMPSPALTVVIDTAAPAINSVDTAPPTAAAGDKVTVSVETTDNVGIDSAVCEGVPLTLSGGNMWTGGIPASATLGKHPVSSVVTDIAGNIANDSSGLYKTFMVVGTANRNLADPIMVAASGNFLFKIWGRVEIIDSESFWLDDGSGLKVKVVALGYSGIQNGDYALARGSVDLGSGKPVLYSRLDHVQKMD